MIPKTSPETTELRELAEAASRRITEALRRINESLDGDCAKINGNGHGHGNGNGHDPDACEDERE